MNKVVLEKGTFYSAGDYCVRVKDGVMFDAQLGHEINPVEARETIAVLQAALDEIDQSSP